ncbi:MAG: hypothetical protein HYV26_18215 [Candidatus Hydrogenedentes bacterium]|nr:hypothetical protein [Candidatus Hydrogenedentota bacterium]MBI3117963.1 hypothetical protein [Candidatus Hydrogenedentota bacterium]
MRHVRPVSMWPAKAQTDGICANVEDDYEARLCFIVEVLTTFLLPLLQAKNDTGSETA